MKTLAQFVVASTISMALAITASLAQPTPTLAGGWAPAPAADRAFTIDSAPGVAPADSGSQWAAEQQIGITVNTPYQVKVGVNTSTTPFATLTQPGWYTFAMTYRRSGNLTTDPVLTDMYVFKTSDMSLMGSSLGVSSGMESQKLRGPSYIWLPLWQNGFASNILAVDNIRAGTFVFDVNTPPDVTTANLYQYGFETAATGNDWLEYDGSLPTLIPSGGGTMLLTASEGNNYVETEHSTLYPTYGSGGYSYFGIPDVDGDPEYHGDYFMAMDIFVLPVPEPSGFALLAVGAAFLVRRRRR